MDIERLQELNTANLTTAAEFILEAVEGSTAARPGLEETPQRFAAAMRYYTKGYQEDPAEILKVFRDGAEEYKEFLIVKDIPFYSLCEHHLAPFFGTVSIGYRPTGAIVGLSKLSRLVDVFARRLQVQERLTTQIAESLFQHLSPRSVAVMVRARHMCMEMRGIERQGAETISYAFRHQATDAADRDRSEFLTAVFK